MKEYVKPIIEDEEISIEDICISSKDEVESDFSDGTSIM